MSTRFQPLQGVQDAKAAQAFDQVSRALDSAIVQPTFSARVDAIVNVNAGAVVRLAPRAAGQTAVLPTADASNAGRYAVLLVNGLGALTVTAANGTLNGASALVYAAGAYAVVLQSDGAGAWLADALIDGSVTTAKLGALSVTTSKLAANAVTNAKLATMAQATIKGRASGAGTGDPTDLTGAQVGDILEPEALVWTNSQTFGHQLLLGNEQTDAGTGAVNVTLGNVVRLRFTSAAGNITLGTVSGSAEGRLLCVEFTGTGVHTITHTAAGADGFACPGDTPLVITGRGGFLAVGRGSPANWKILATTN